MRIEATHRDMPQSIDGRIKVLLYHRVVDTISSSCFYPSVCVSVEAFRHQMRMLERWGFTTITFEDYRLSLDGEIQLPRKPVILTFDDAYADFHEIAFPVLQDYGMRAVVFPVAEKKMTLNTWDHSTAYPVVPLMSESQLLDIHASGFEIGSHTLTHVPLPHVPREKAWDEIYRSRIELEAMLNAPVRTFSFPYGLISEDVKQMVVDAGYERACATYTGPAKFGIDWYEIRRATITGNCSALRFALLMLTPYEYVLWTRWKVKQLIVNPLRGARRAGYFGKAHTAPVSEKITLSYTDGNRERDIDRRRENAGW